MQVDRMTYIQHKSTDITLVIIPTGRVVAMTSGSSPRYFPSAPAAAIEITARRVLMVSCHASLWLGSTFADYRDTPDAKRAHALLMFALEVAIRSRCVCCFETVFDSVYTKIDLKRPVFIRLWIFLSTDERIDAFNATAQEMVMCPAEAEEVGGRHAKGGKKVATKRKRGKGADPRGPMGPHLITNVNDLSKCLVQQRMSHADETMEVTFDHAGIASDLAMTDLVDEDGDDGPAGDDLSDDPPTSFICKLSARAHFEHAVVQLAAKSNRVSDPDATFATYVKNDADGNMTFAVTDAERLSRLRLLDMRSDSGGNWLQSSMQLLTFMHPYFTPSAHDLEQWLQAQAAVVGLSASDLEVMTREEIEAQINELMLSPALYAPITAVSIGVSSGAATWSDCRYEEVYPENAAWMAACRRDTLRIERAIALGQLPPSETRHNVEHIVADLRMCAAEPLKGWPPAYSKVRRSVARDMLQFNRVLQGSDEFARETSRITMFPFETTEDGEGGVPENMTRQTFVMVQFVELQRCEFGLDRPQSHMNAVIYPWSFVLLVPAFGYPGSIQARGPPGSGKGEAKKRLQPCVNIDMWFNVDSISEQGTTYTGLPEQCFWDMDENMSQGKSGGSTLTQQTTDSNGISKRARASADEEVTKCIAVACRHVNLGSSNLALNEAMKDRAVDIDLPRAMGEIRTAVTPGAPHMAAAFRILTGLSVWPWLFAMAGLFDWEETVLEMFVGINAVMLPKSKLAGHARTKESIRILAIGISVFEIVSMYYRCEMKELKEDGSYNFLTFVRANAMLSPTAVWEAYLLITTGTDPRRDSKVLSIFKQNLKQLPGGMYDTMDDDLYFASKFVKTNADTEPKEFNVAANACGLGQAIAEEGLASMLAKKDTKSGHPILKLVQESPGSSRLRYAVLASAVSTLTVLTAAESGILDCLLDVVAKKQAYISADETQYIFKESIRSRLLAPTPKDPMGKYGSRDIMAANELLKRVDDLGYESEAGLLKNIAVVHPTELPSSQVAIDGGPLDPNGVGVLFGAMPFGNVIAVDIEGLRSYKRMRDGLTPAESDATNMTRRMGSRFFRACGAPAGEKVFAGVGDSDEVNSFMVIDDADDATPINIENPRYTHRANRLTRSVKDPNESVLFKRSQKSVRVGADLHLCRKINAFNANRYPDTGTLAYNYP